MGDRTRLVAVYFGLADLTPEEKAAMPPPRPLWQSAIALLIVAVVMGGLVALVAQDVGTGLRAAFIGVFASQGAQVYGRVKDHRNRHG